MIKKYRQTSLPDTVWPGTWISKKHTLNYCTRASNLSLYIYTDGLEHEQKKGRRTWSSVVIQSEAGLKKTSSYPSPPRPYVYTRYIPQNVRALSGTTGRLLLYGVLIKTRSPALKYRTTVVEHCTYCFLWSSKCEIILKENASTMGTTGSFTWIPNWLLADDPWNNTCA